MYVIQKKIENGGYMRTTKKLMIKYMYMYW